MKKLLIPLITLGAFFAPVNANADYHRLVGNLTIYTVNADKTIKIYCSINYKITKKNGISILTSEVPDPLTDEELNELKQSRDKIRIDNDERVEYITEA